MKGYWIVKANTVNAEKQKDYASFASKAVEKYGGKYLVRGGQSLDKEGSIFERNVVVEFDTYEIAKQAYESDCLLYTSPSPRDGLLSRMPSSA